MNHRPAFPEAISYGCYRQIASMGHTAYVDGPQIKLLKFTVLMDDNVASVQG